VALRGNPRKLLTRRLRLRDLSRAKPNLGMNAGRVFRIGKLPVNALVGAYYNVVTPQYGADWQLRTQVTASLRLVVAGGGPDGGEHAAHWAVRPTVRREVEVK